MSDPSDARPVRRSGSAPAGDRRTRLVVTLVLLGGFVAFLAATGPDNGWNWERVWSVRDGKGWPLLFGRALLVTLGVSAGALLLSLVFGFAGGLMRLSPRPVPSQLGAIYVEVVRGTPLLVQLFIAVYCVGYSLGIDDHPVLVGTATLGLFAGAYVTEIVRGAIQSIDPGQTEAALSQGMSRWQLLRRVLLPQAVRRMLPPLTGEFVSLVKDSSLLSVIGVVEISKRAGEARAETYRTYEIYLPLALFYLLITFPLSRWARRLELRASAS
jgi:polar amino acid transport system permease protein